MSNAAPATDPRQQSLPLDQPLRTTDDDLSPILAEILAASVQSSGLSKRSQYDLLKTQIAPGCTDEELALFMQIARSRGFDPFSKHLYARKQRAWDNEKRDYVQKMIIITGIDAFRLKAARTKEHTGTSDALFTYDPKEIGPLNPKGIVKVTMTVTRLDHRFEATCYWSEYAQTYKANGVEALVPMWLRMPHNQLEKCNEGKCLRRAFPEEFSDIYTDDEIVPGERIEVKPATNGVTAHVPSAPTAQSAPTATAATVTKPADVPVTDKWKKAGEEAETLLKSCKHKGELADAFKKLGKLLPKKEAPLEIRQKIGQMYSDLEASLPTLSGAVAQRIGPMATMPVDSVPPAGETPASVAAAAGPKTDPNDDGR